MADLVPHLRCPVCHCPLTGAPRSLRCHRGHSFDLARAGYAHLATGRLTHPGDPVAMVAARETFLASGGYDFISAALSAAAAPYSGLVVDVGGGTGHHLARVLDARQQPALGLTVDVSKPALRRAARAHPRAGAVLADTWRALPLRDHTAGVLLNVFAPRNPAELHRTLHPDGALLVVTPTPAHLAELRPALPGLRLLTIDPTKPTRLAATLDPWFCAIDTTTTTHTHQLALPRPLIRALVQMGPSAAHTDPSALAAAVADLPEPFPVTAAVHLTRYRPRQPPRCG
ncbi:MAG: 23S rRNA methyltransferase [Micromonosporaceae bacterium]|nr:23S rRNA methyltransferase [Micromonosporaceae bacterium]